MSTTTILLILAGLLAILQHYLNYKFFKEYTEKPSVIVMPSDDISEDKIYKFVGTQSQLDKINTAAELGKKVNCINNFVAYTYPSSYDKGKFVLEIHVSNNEDLYWRGVATSLCNGFYEIVSAD